MTLLNAQTGEKAEVVATMGICIARTACEDLRSVGETDKVQWMRKGVWRSTVWRRVLGKGRGKNGHPQRVTYMCVEVYDGFARPLGIKKNKFGLGKSRRLWKHWQGCGNIRCT